MAKMGLPRIDVHSHVIPKEMLDAMDLLGGRSESA